MLLAALPPTPPSQLPPARILVYADEFRFNGSRGSGPSGKWRLNLKNNGQDPHDLQIRNNTTRVVLARSGLFLPGANGTITIRLKPGSYMLFCGVPGHEALGMKWKLLVRKPKIRRTAP